MVCYAIPYQHHILYGSMLSRMKWYMKLDATTYIISYYTMLFSKAYVLMLFSTSLGSNYDMWDVMSYLFSEAKCNATHFLQCITQKSLFWSMYNVDWYVMWVSSSNVVQTCAVCRVLCALPSAVCSALEIIPRTLHVE